ncbi:MAG TPA: guanine deaminase [Devosiaceae bacterium]
MSQTVLRGRILTFTDAPRSAEDTDCVRYIVDGAIVIENGQIIAAGEYTEVGWSAPATSTVIDHRPHLITPGFIDPHIHFSQMQVIGSFGVQLLDWLNTYTFVEEQKFGDPEHASRIASLFFDEMIRHGTTTAAAYCTVHAASADAFFTEAKRRNMLMIGGKVMMDREAPRALTDTAQSGYDETRRLIRKWHGRGRALYAITPRFAITSTPEQLEAAGALAEEFPGCYVQTHLSENHDEIAFTQSLYPEAPDYTGVYEQFGLLGPRTLLGHCIHLSEREIEALAYTGSVAVFCPTSNLFLGSGLFDWQRLAEGGVRIAVATDVGGGTSYSMLRTFDEAYKVLQLNGQTLTPLLSFYMMTLGNARALSLSDRIGSIEPGQDADLVVLDAGATPAGALRMETVTSLSEELFVLQTMGDDRSIVETYVAGVGLKSRLAY